MAESQSGFDMAEYKAELDRGMRDVMPDDWFGHARFKIATEGFGEKKAGFAEKLASRILEKTDVDPEKAAELAIEKVEEKF